MALCAYALNPTFNVLEWYYFLGRGSCLLVHSPMRRSTEVGLTSRICDTSSTSIITEYFKNNGRYSFIQFDTFATTYHGASV